MSFSLTVLKIYLAMSYFISITLKTVYFILLLVLCSLYEIIQELKTHFQIGTRDYQSVLSATSFFSFGIFH